MDDEETIGKLLFDYFRNNGWDITIADTGSRAIELADEAQFDVVIMDVNLAGENGLELLGFFRSNFPKLPVVMFTGVVDHEDVLEKAVARGASGFMRKTDPLADLFSAVKSYVPQA